jgi:hypothetical protein
MTPEIRAELRKIMSGLFDRQLSDADFVRLEELLQDADCRQLYLQEIDVHTRLMVHPGIGKRLEVIAPYHATPQARRPYFTHLVVAAASILACLLIQQGWQFTHPDVNSRPIEAVIGGDPSLEYVATLASANGCIWERQGESWRAGSRLLPGEIRLREGLAKIHFDSGADLVIEGPVIVKLESSSSATLVQGKAVFRTDESTLPFDLRTPSSSIADYNTEYAVMVNREGEELHVFDGEIQRTPRRGDVDFPMQQLRAGEARKYEGTTVNPGQPTVLDAPRFVRATHDPQADPSQGLLAYEGFHYGNSSDLKEGRANGGSGWKGHWVYAFGRPIGDWPASKSPLVTNEGLTISEPSQQASDGSYQYKGFTKAFRPLAKPIRLDQDGVYYISYLFRRTGPSINASDIAALLLWPEADALKQEGEPRNRLNLGVAGSNRLFFHLEGSSARQVMPIAEGEVYRFVAKIVASRDFPDQVFIRVYAPQETVEQVETSNWSILSPSFHSDQIFDWVQLHINSACQQSLDELRIGTTWASVTNAWGSADRKK